MDKATLEQSSRNIINTCVERDFFTIEGAKEAAEFFGIDIKESMLDDEIQGYENRAAPILKKIRDTNSFNTVDNKRDISFLVEWITWLFVANPDIRDFFALRNRNKLWTNTQVGASFIDYHQRIVPFFLARNWQLGTSQYALITSDRPVSLDRNMENIKDINELDKAIISITLSPELLLVGTPNKNRSFHIMEETRELTEEIAHFSNLNNFMNAKSFLIARHSESFEHLLAPYQ